MSKLVEEMKVLSGIKPLRERSLAETLVWRKNATRVLAEDPQPAVDALGKIYDAIDEVEAAIQSRIDAIAEYSKNTTLDGTKKKADKNLVPALKNVLELLEATRQSVDAAAEAYDAAGKLDDVT